MRFSHSRFHSAFAANLGHFFSPTRPGRFLVYSGNFGLVGADLASFMTAAGHQWTVDLFINGDGSVLDGVCAALSR